ncbi:MAG: tagaturonate epimerase family protein [Clostridia bacterium]|nr:tagaturonate epimerase family protein [Clostridia bacterium]
MEIYPKSTHAYGGARISMLRGPDADLLHIEGPNPGFEGRREGDALLAPCSHENAALLRRLFPFTAPAPVLGRARSLGLGDRLGIAGPGHLRALARCDAAPVLAQQSMRELRLTGRSYSEVIDCASFAVFREDFRQGFGADGDHLKTGAEVEYALRSGCSMITLDCSDQILGAAAVMDEAALRAAYRPDAAQEALYLEKSFDIGDLRVSFPAAEFMRACLIYGEALRHAEDIYRTHIAGRPVDFEISIDETLTPTSPAQHYFVAAELVRRGVRFATIAPRFCGEFQKGVDYIGDRARFERELAAHAAIADHFGYKLSIHSGSDKFSVFPAIGRLSRGRFHVKTAGTSWLEAVRVAAMADPALYRELHAFALEVFDEAKQYYHVGAQPENIPALETLSDAALPGLLDMDDARQLIHITYGLILGAADASGAPRFKERLFRLWRENAELYAERLDRHIGRHIQLLYQDIPQAQDRDERSQP